MRSFFHNQSVIHYDDFVRFFYCRKSVAIIIEVLFLVIFSVALWINFSLSWSMDEWPRQESEFSGQKDKLSKMIIIVFAQRNRRTSFAHHIIVAG
jgi:hypothetical protein